MSRQQGTVPKKRPDETDEAYALRLVAWSNGEDIRSKTDLKDWTGSFPFHLNKEEP